MEKKINIIVLLAGIFMIIVSILNYMLNNDHVMPGIFGLSGIGFVLLGVKEKYKDKTAKRINKYAMSFFFGASFIFLYWLAVAKLNLF